VKIVFQYLISPLNAELNPICHLLALLGAHHILHISRIRVKIQLSVLMLLLAAPQTRYFITLRKSQFSSELIRQAAME